MKIKICGLTRSEDIWAVNQAGPDYIGFVFAPGSRREVSEEQAAKLKKQLAPGILSVGVFVDAPEERICSIAARQIIDVIQLHGSETAGDVDRLKRKTGLPIIKALSMTGENAGEQLRMWERTQADYLLLDSKSGGSGEMFDHSRIGRCAKPFFLAGGLNPDNLKVAAEQVGPFAVDLSSGVETDGVKDQKKIKEAVRRIRDVER